jgi:hypothetical protein
VIQVKKYSQGKRPDGMEGKGSGIMRRLAQDVLIALEITAATGNGRHESAIIGGEQRTGRLKRTLKGTRTFRFPTLAATQC